MANPAGYVTLGKPWGLLLLLCLRGWRSLPAQTPELSQAELVRAESARIARERTHILKGEVVQHTLYFDSAKQRAYHASLLRVDRWVMGSPRADTVQVVTRGGYAVSVTYEDGRVTYSEGFPTHGTGGAGPRLPWQQPVVLFCRPLPANYPARPPRESALSARPLEVLGIAYPYEQRFVSDIGGEFASQEAFEVYLNQLFQLPRQSPVQDSSLRDPSRVTAPRRR
ncbi:hypothetical protein DNI29_23125 [Hymenobacter sediminis]|uniref:hypothetical protein n=1 Tax=Hymenobacter sediminis TaxID=2218621 RepID=UPI000DA6657C|nr:hypothetical protein [Hymenobacter sediminis]RPD43755.1 hypothetical protein DNI29_23125 [Hymenobacter sediminis]